SHNIEDLAAIVQTLSSASALTVWQTILEVARRGGVQNPGRSSDTQAEHSQDPSRASSSSHIQGRSDEVSSSNASSHKSYLRGIQATSNVSRSHNASASASSTSRPRQQSRHSRTPSPVSLSLSQSKGKRRELPIDRRHKRQKLSTPGIDTSSSDSSIPPPPLSSSTRRDRQIFKTDSGQPLVFVVQAGMRNRKELADTIKNHGGKLGAEIPQADYIVLAHNVDYFKDLLTATVAAGKPAVRAAYVYECARQGVLLDEADFSFDGFEVRGKRRGRSFTVDLARLQRANKPKINEGASHEIHKAKNKSPSVKGHLAARDDKTHGSMPLPVGKSPRRRASSVHRPSSSRSPTPPRNVVQFSATRNRYTDEDRAYFSVYVAHLLKGDPDMSLSAITLKLAQKMPHHSRASWLTVSSTHPSMRDVIDELRRNAHKIRREQESLAGTREHDVDIPHSTPTAPALPLQPSSQISGGPNVPLFPSVPTQAQIPEVDLPMQLSKIAGGSNVPQVPSVPTQTQIPEAASDDSAYAEDFELITRVLADGCADTRTDQEVWDALTKIYVSVLIRVARKQPCRTARTWGEFFDQNENDIYKVVTQTMQQAEDISVKLER
ncbi:hypothetical protein PHLCEN_2v520, partial [Hermanssonia centrifuga]